MVIQRYLHRPNNASLEIGNKSTNNSSREDNRERQKSETDSLRNRRSGKGRKPSNPDWIKEKASKESMVSTSLNTRHKRKQQRSNKTQQQGEMGT